MQPWVVGIDASTVSVAFVSGESDEHVVATKVKLKNEMERPYRAYMATKRYLRRLEGLPGADPTIAAVESPLMNHRNVQVTIKQSIVNGAIQAALISMGLQVVLIQPSSWKKRAFGKGNLDKDAVRGAIKSGWPHIADALGDDQDLSDAFGLFLTGLEIRNEAAVLRGQTTQVA